MSNEARTDSALAGAGAGADARPPNVADLLTLQAIQTPDALAVIHPGGSVSYRDLDALVWGSCTRLHTEGLRAGDVVGLHLSDTLAHLTWLLALARCGMPSVAVAVAGGDTGAGRVVLARLGARSIIDDAELDWGLPRQVRVAGTAGLSASAASAEALRCTRPSQVMVYKTSSGTTGEPKIVAATHAGMIASIEREQSAIGYPAGERYLTPVAISHDGPRRRFLACLASGGTLVLPPPRSSVATLLDLIDRHDVRHFSSVPVQAYQLATAVPAGRVRFPRMRCLRLSAGPSEATLHRLLRERLTDRVLVSYGCTELGPMTVADPDLLARVPQTVGRPMPGVEVEVVSDKGEPLPPGQVGQVRVRAAGMPNAYHDDAQASARAFRGGWFWPGDLGRLDPQGHLFHLGRTDDVMVFNGINICPAEVEQAMLAHPAVHDVVALPLKLPVIHELPACAVVLAPGASASPQALLEYARRKLGARGPKRLVVLEAIPRNEFGKVRRDELLKAFQIGLATSNTGAAAPAPAQAARQLAHGLSLSFTPVPNADFARLDAWLALLLDASEFPVCVRVAQAVQPGEEARSVGLLYRMLLLARALLLAARVPMFDPPVIASYRPPAQSAGGPWSVHITLPLVEGLPRAARDIALAEAGRLLAWAVANVPGESERKEFYRQIEQRVLKRLAALWPIGKSTLPVLRAAWQASIPIAHLGGGVFQLGWGCRSRRIYKSVSSEDRAIAARLSANKALAAALLDRAGLPVPEHRVVTRPQEAAAAATALGWPVVVKPVDLERGEGVVVDVGDDEALATAVRAACALSPSRTALVERQIEGMCHRLFIARGKLLYAVKRLPMSVQGDGVRDVGALIAAEVQRQSQLPPWCRSGIEPLDDNARAAIARAGYAVSSVPAAGAWVPLRRIETTAWGGVDEDVSTLVHPENLRIALAAAELFGLDMAGVDIITTDISRPWHAAGAVINEVNYAPLLGGGEISRSHIPAFLRDLVPGDGTIPAEVFVGGDSAWGAARARWQAMCGAGVAAFLTGATCTLGADGGESPTRLAGLYRRVRALVMNPHVAAIVLVVQTDEVASSGFPLEAVDAVHVVDDHLSRADGSAPLAPARAAALIDAVRRWPRRVPR